MCKYCKYKNINDNLEEYLMYDGEYMNFEVKSWIFANYLYVRTTKIDIDTKIEGYTKINYCPMCGRKLKND